MYQMITDMGLRIARKTGLIRSDAFRRTVLGGFRTITPSRLRISAGDSSEVEIDPEEPAELLYLLDYSSHETGVEAAIRDELDADSTFLDIGAFIGYYTLIGCEEIEEGKVIAFEPFPSHENRVRHNASINEYDVKVEPIALSDENGKKSISESGSPTLKEDGSISVSTMRLDDYVSRNDLDSIDLMKVDIEGAENRLLSGGERTLVEHSSTIILELHPEKLSNQGSSVADVLRNLDNLGYKFEKLPERKSIAVGDSDYQSYDSGWVKSNPHIICYQS